MSLVKSTAAFFLSLTVGVVATRAAAPDPALPAGVVASDTVAVVHVDTAHFNPDKLQATAVAMLGDDAKELDEPIRKFKEMFTKATSIGMDGMTMVVGAPQKDDPDGRNGNGIIYISLKEGADVKAIETLLTEKIMERGDKHTIIFDQAGNLLAMHRKTQVFPVKPDADREAIFADALGTLTDASIQVAFIPDQEFREKMKQTAASSPDANKDFRRLLAKSTWMGLAIKLGTAPSVTASADVGNESDAKAMINDIKADLADIKTQTSKPGPMILVAPLIQKVIDGLKLSQDSSRVAVAINAESLKLIADFADTMGVFDGSRR